MNLQEKIKDKMRINNCEGHTMHLTSTFPSDVNNRTKLIFTRKNAKSCNVPEDCQLIKDQRCAIYDNSYAKTHKMMLLGI